MYFGFMPASPRFGRRSTSAGSGSGRPPVLDDAQADAPLVSDRVLDARP